jgi:dihydroxy-acid dehydratase
MDARTFDKKNLPSRHVTEGPSRAPHRSYYYAMGLTKEQIHQPFVGVATCWNEAAPCNIALSRQAQAAKKGVAAAGGTPREFTTITVTDGIAMGHQGMKSSLVSREVIADSVELTIRGHCYDALIGLAGCDKSLPGMMMAMCRLNVPSIFIYGGSILPGTFRGRQVTVQDLFEAVGMVSVGKMSAADLDELEQVACPSAGACGAQFTANTMATVSEAIGLALPYSAGAPAPYEIRDRFCMAAGEKIMTLIARNIRPRDIVTRDALENAATVVAASGGSTNAGLHLPAIAHECGIKFDLFDVAAIFKRTPYIADLKPGGRYVAKDMFEAGGVPLLMKTLLDEGFLHGDCMTVTGRTIAENMAQVTWNADQDVVRPANNPITPTGGVVGLRGNLAAEGAIVKVAGMKNLRFSGPARCFDSEEECFDAVASRNYREGEVLVIRYEGPRGGPGCGKCCPRPPLFTARVWATRSRSSPMAGFPGRPAAFASGTLRRRRRSAARSASCMTATSSRSTLRQGASKRRFRRRNLTRAAVAGSRARRTIDPARYGNMRRWSDRRGTARSPIRVGMPKR